MPDESPNDSESQLAQKLGITYPFSDFYADFQKVGQLNPEKQTCPQELFEYFRARYPKQLASERMGRCVGAVSYWQENKEAFDTGNVSVTGKQTTLLRGHFIAWLWLAWCRKDCDWETYNPPVGDFISLCESVHKAEP